MTQSISKARSSPKTFLQNQSWLNRIGLNLSSLLKKYGQLFLPTQRGLVIGGPYLWLLLLFFTPFLLLIKISFADLEMAVPPYTPLLGKEGSAILLRLQFSNYIFLVTDTLYLAAYLSSLKIAAITTALCLLLGYPMAYAIMQAKPNHRHLWLMAVILPFWTSSLIRVYAWIGILKNNGLLNQFLLSTHIINTPIELYRTDWAVYIGMIYTYLPFLIMPLYAHLIKLDQRLQEAAYDLGARPWVVFCRITMPLSKNGIVAGCLLVFIPAVGEYVIPELLGGANTLMIGKVMWNEFFGNSDWPMAAAVTCAMVLILLVPMTLLQRAQMKENKNDRV